MLTLTWLTSFFCGACKEKSTVIDPAYSPKIDELWVNRFLGLEIYHIESAEWNLYRDEEDGRINLWIHLDCDKAISQFEDTDYTNTIPSWELNLLEQEIEVIKGFEANIPEGYDESRGGWITNFYAGSHDGSDKNTIRVLEVEGERILLRLTGEIVDPNFYDDSKPRSSLLVETWFSRNKDGGRSMQ